MKAEATNAQANERRKSAYMTNTYVFLALAFLTILEFFIALWTDGSAALLFIAAILKTALIANFFMHIYRIWSEEAH